MDKVGQIQHFDNSFYRARKFADEERYRWRKSIAPEKKIKNFITHYVIRIVGGVFYSKQINIPE